VHIDQNEGPFGVGTHLGLDGTTQGNGNSPNGHTLEGQFFKSFHTNTSVNMSLFKPPWLVCVGDRAAQVVVVTSDGISQL
jgi:hypothetical protein